MYALKYAARRFLLAHTRSIVYASISVRIRLSISLLSSPVVSFAAQHNFLPRAAGVPTKNELGVSGSLSCGGKNSFNVCCFLIFPAGRYTRCLRCRLNGTLKT